MQKYEVAADTHKKAIVLVLEFCNFLLYSARIGYENTYEMHGMFHRCSEMPRFGLGPTLQYLPHIRHLFVFIPSSAYAAPTHNREPGHYDKQGDDACGYP